MPHVNSRGGEDLASTDEVKVYNDEGHEEIEQRSSEKFLSEDKFGLVTETEEEKPSLSGHGFQVNGKSNGSLDDKNSGSSLAIDHSVNHFSFFYHHPYSNGASGLMGKVPAFHPHPGLVPYNDFIAPPPAHSGIQVLPVPAVHLVDPKTGLPRSTMFPLATGSGAYPLYPDFASAMQPWQNLGYPAVSPAGFRNPYIRYAGGLLSSSHPQLSSGITGMSQPALVTPGPKQEVCHNLAGQFMHQVMSEEQAGIKSPHQESAAEQAAEKKRLHIKKPLNAFMLFMKEMRAKVVSECTLKESAAINQILGRKWHALERTEQAKYYEMAKKEREVHMKLYPGWSARDNYAMHSKKKKRRRESLSENKECSNPKKCRARFGLDQQSQWCKPCRRKKKCIRFMTGDPNADTRDSDSEDDCCDQVAADTTNDVDGGDSASSCDSPFSESGVGCCDDSCSGSGSLFDEARTLTRGCGPASSREDAVSSSTAPMSLLHPMREDT